VRLGADKMKRVCVLGLGHIGLPTAILVAQSGYQVVGVDTDENIVRMLNNGISHLQEAGIDILLRMFAIPAVFVQKKNLRKLMPILSPCQRRLTKTQSKQI